MKKKILALCLVVVLAVTAVTGATLAYFTDTDEEINEFTIGKVDIDLEETFDKDTAKLFPDIDINKDAWIELEAGSEDAYVWMTYAIPAVLDNPDDASLNIIHVNAPGCNWDDYRENSKYWEEGQTEAKPLEQTWDVDWKVEKNGYTDEDGIAYNVYTYLYHGKLSAGEKTTLGLTKVYMDSKVDAVKDANGVPVAGKFQINGTEINYDFSNGVKIPVKAYAIQAEGFADVYEAYNGYYGK